MVDPGELPPQAPAGLVTGLDIPEGGGSEYLEDRAARGRDKTEFTAYVAEEGTVRGT